MINCKLFILLILIFSSTTQEGIAQSKRAYQIFTATGKKVGFDKMVKNLAKADIVLFGELHNDPIAHWLQIELAQTLSAQRKLILGAEMIETDNQQALTDYLTGKLSLKQLETNARLWSNFKTDYLPMVDFAKSNQLPFIATNIPRRYASQVFKGGFEVLDTLAEKDKSWIVPLPIAYDPNLPGYRKMLDMVKGHSGDNFPKAQAIKDATMAHVILKNYTENALFLHLNGAYHSDNFEGILWYLKEQSPELTYRTISTVLQKDVSKLNIVNRKLADFIIVVDEDMTRTY